MIYTLLSQVLLLLVLTPEVIDAKPIFGGRNHPRYNDIVARQTNTQAAYLQQARDAEAGRNSGWQAMGCIKDSPTRTLNGIFLSWDNMTLPICMNECFGRSYTYGGVQYGRECWCGNSIRTGYFYGSPPDQYINWGDQYGVLVPYSECQSFPCAGDPSTACGNHWRNNVFMVADRSAASAAIAASSSASAASVSAAAYSSKAAVYSASAAAAYSVSASAYSSSSAAAARATASAAAAWSSSNAVAYSSSSAAAAKASQVAWSSSSLAASASAWSAAAAASTAASLAAYSQSVSAAYAAQSMAAYSSQAAQYSASSINAASSAAAYSAAAAKYSASVNNAASSAAAYSAASYSAAAYSASAAQYSASVNAAAASASAYSAAAAQYSASANAAAYSASAAQYSASINAAAASASAYSAAVAQYSASANVAASSAAAYSASSAAAYSAAASQWSASAVAASAAAYSQGNAFSSSSLAASASAYSANLAASASAFSANAAAQASASAYSASSSAAAAAAATGIPSTWSVPRTACVAEGTSGRALTGSSIASPDMTQGKCVKYCNDAGFVLAGIEYSTECYCGNVLEHGASLDKSSPMCNMQCGGSSDICGGPSALTLFVSNAAVSSLSSDFTSKPITLKDGWEKASTECVQEGTTGRALTGASFADDAMLPSKCMEFCKSKNFKLAGVEYGRECYCGNELTNGASLDRVSQTCNMGCSGNPTVLCGGPNGIQLFSNPTIGQDQVAASASSSAAAVAAQSSTAASIQAKLPSGWAAASTNCIEEVQGRALTGGSYASNDMTIEKCVTFCSNKGFSLAGIEYGAECYCGNALANGASLDRRSSQCTMQCAGDQTQTCGGPNGIQLYTGTPSVTATATSTSVTPSATPAGPQLATNLPSGWSAAGNGQNCIQEVNGRALPDYSEASDDMTINKCIDICSSRGFKLAGVEYSKECFCSQELRNGASLDLISGQCNMGCGGDSTILCGGPNAIQLYTNPNAVASPTASPSAVVSAAPAGPTPATNLPSGWRESSTKCLQEVDGRALTGYLVSENGMTISKCLSICGSKGFHFAGVEYGSECHCGSVLSNGASLSKSSTSCSMGCSGDATVLCGGPNALQLYENDVSAQVDGFVHKGCMQEVVGRALNATSLYDGGMTVEKCVGFCKSQGYSQAGLEYGQECFCGNGLVNGASLDSVSYECKMPCAGNSAQICGGPDAINLYVAQ